MDDIDYGVEAEKDLCEQLINWKDKLHMMDIAFDTEIERRYGPDVTHVANCHINKKDVVEEHIMPKLSSNAFIGVGLVGSGEVDDKFLGIYSLDSSDIEIFGPLYEQYLRS